MSASDDSRDPPLFFYYPFGTSRACGEARGATCRRAAAPGFVLRPLPGYKNLTDRLGCAPEGGLLKMCGTHGRARVGLFDQPLDRTEGMGRIDQKTGEGVPQSWMRTSARPVRDAAGSGKDRDPKGACLCHVAERAMAPARGEDS